MKKTMLLVFGFIVGVTFIIHCGGSSPTNTKAADDPQASISDLQTKIDVLSARITALENDNNYNLAENIKGMWKMKNSVVNVVNGNVFSTEISINFDGNTFSCSANNSQYLLGVFKPCDGSKREYVFDKGLLVMKNIPNTTGATLDVGFVVSISDSALTLLASGSDVWYGTKQ